MPTKGRDDAVTCEYVSKPYELVENRVSRIESCIRAMSPQMRRQVGKQFLVSDHDKGSIEDRGEPIYTPFTGVSGQLVRNCFADTDEVSARARILANYRVCWGPLQTRKDT